MDWMACSRDACTSKPCWASTFDPIADKLLLSTLFLVLAILHKIPWKYTVMVFSRDISILAASAVLYAIAGLRDFSPSIFGKANTFAQVSAVFFVLLFQVEPMRPVWVFRTVFLWATFAFTVISGVHYAFLVQHRLHSATHSCRFAACARRARCLSDPFLTPPPPPLFLSVAPWRTYASGRVPAGLRGIKRWARRFPMMIEVAELELHPIDFQRGVPSGRHRSRS